MCRLTTARIQRSKLFPPKHSSSRDVALLQTIDLDYEQELAEAQPEGSLIGAIVLIVGATIGAVSLRIHAQITQRFQVGVQPRIDPLVSMRT